MTLRLIIVRAVHSSDIRVNCVNCGSNQQTNRKKSFITDRRSYLNFTLSYSHITMVRRDMVLQALFQTFSRRK